MTTTVGPSNDRSPTLALDGEDGDLGLEAQTPADMDANDLADAVETLEAWQIAIARDDGPSVLCLTRQNLPTLRTVYTAENQTAKGGYVLAEAEGGTRQATLIATGSEVAIAMEARKLLAAEGIQAAVVSMPCLEAFDRQTAKYRKDVLGPARTPRIVCEAGLSAGWDKYIDGKGAFVGMTGFGASAPAPDLYKHFGITAEAIAAAAKKSI